VASLTPTGPSYPNLDRFTAPLDRFAYRAAYDECGIGDPVGLAHAYGGSPTDPASIARAYAEFANPSHAEAASLGCLDALRTAAVSPS
jgi:hypothetical protein